MVLRLLGLFYGEFNAAIKELVRAIPLLLIPLVFALNLNNRVEKPLYFGVLTALLGILIWCEIGVVTSIVENGESLRYFFKWPYLNFNFLGGLDLHPAYLGLFIVWTLYHTLFGNYIMAGFKYVVAVLLTVFLFQLLARNAMIVTLVMGTVFVWNHKKIWLKLLYISIIIGLLSIIGLQKSYYLRNKIFYALEGNKSIDGQNRFERLSASFEVFAESPLFGVGPGNDNRLRRQVYLEDGEEVAHELNYNAHNQFVEYLSTYGLLGAITFCYILVFFGYRLYKANQLGYLFLWLAFAFSCSTESVLERSMGIKYFALLTGLIIWHLWSRERQESKLNIKA